MEENLEETRAILRLGFDGGFRGKEPFGLTNQSFYN
jgi:hypothetical protein